VIRSSIPVHCRDFLDVYICLSGFSFGEYADSFDIFCFSSLSELDSGAHLLRGPRLTKTF
jgi:hypothetical protein